MSEPTRHEELSDRYFADLLGDEETAELERLLTSGPEAARAFAAAAREERQWQGHFRRLRDAAVVDELVRTATSPDSTSADNSVALPAAAHVRHRPSGGARRFAAAALLLVTCGAGLVWVATRPAASRPSYEIVSGTISIGGVAAGAIPDGVEFEVTGLTPAVIRLADGSRAELAPVSRAVLRRDLDSPRQAIVLARGSGRFQVEKQQREFRVETPVGNVTALGTEFTVEVRPAEPPSPRPVEIDGPAGIDGLAGALIAAPTQLLVAVLAGEVAVAYGDETYSLGLGDDRVYAVPQTMPVDKPDVVGKVVAVVEDDQSAAITITVESTKSAATKATRQTFRLFDDTRLAWVNVPVDRQRPSLGYTAAIWRDRAAKGSALAVRFEVAKNAGPPPQITGRVIQVSSDGRTITLEPPHHVKTHPRPTRTVVLDPATAVSYFFVPLEGEQPAVGYQATVWLAPGSNDRASRIHLSGDKRGDYRPNLVGRVTALSPDTHLLELATKEKLPAGKLHAMQNRRRILIEPDTKIIYEGLAKGREPVGLEATVWLREGSLEKAGGIRFSVPAE